MPSILASAAGVAAIGGLACWGGLCVYIGACNISESHLTSRGLGRGALGAVVSMTKSQNCRSAAESLCLVLVRVSVTYAGVTALNSPTSGGGESAITLGSPTVFGQFEHFSHGVSACDRPVPHRVRARNQTGVG